MDLRNRHILVVEDNLGDFTLVEDFVIDYLGDSVILRAETFAAAKSILLNKKMKFDIVLLDLSLPDLTGESLIRQVIAICDTIPIVVLTGYADLAFGVRSLAMGISDYLIKEDLTAGLLYKSIIYSTERKRIELELKASEKRARRFAAQLNTVLEDERAHMAREIHDEFGQQLSGLKMSLSVLKKNSLSEVDLRGFVDSLLVDLDISIDTVRRLANELRPVIIDKLGLFAAIEWLVVEFGKKTTCVASFSASMPEPVLEKDKEINIFRICQEALTNIIKHADATEAKIEVHQTATGMLVRIIDNGKGLNPNMVGNQLSMGLINMNERAKLIGARLHISSLAPSGTLIELDIENHD